MRARGLAGRLLFALILCARAGAAGAQQVDLQVTPGPHYADVPVEVSIVADGFEEEPTPEATAPAPRTGALELLDVSPQVSSSITIVNGNISRSKQVRFVYRYQYLADAPGDVQLGPFRLTQEGKSRETRAVSLHIESVPASDRLAVELRLPEKRVYVGERVPVELRFRVEEELRDRLESYVLRVPLFDMTESFQFLDDPPADGTALKLRTRSGELELKGPATLEREGGRRFLEVVVTRTAVPLRSGAVRIPPASVVADEATHYRRDLFGGRVASHVRKLRAADRDRALEVSALPRAGRPQSFAGAVGKGFQLDVAADRTVVQVGDPITLTLTLRGDGNLERLGMPPLDEPGLLPKDRFRVPDADLAGVIDGGAKRFTAVVRVIDERQQEIPALEYAWFDPEKERYETTRSRPIALSVRPAEVVGAEDVLSGAPPASGAEEEVAEAAPPAAPAPRDLSSTGADLAIERDVTLLVRDARSAWGGPWLPAGIYAGSALAALFAVFDRRRRLDPEAAARRRTAERQLDAIRQAASAPATQAAADIARALRALAAQLPDAHGAELDALLGECDARAYAPAGLREDGPLDAGFQQRVREVALRLAERVRS